MEEVNKEKNTEKPDFGKRADAYFEKNYAYFFAPIVVLFLYFFALWQYDVYPFSNAYTAASYDLSAQICPFIEHLFDVLQGKSTLTYTYAIMGGADVTGTFLYFFISPFSFLFLIFGDGMVAHASSIVVACKLATIAWAGTWFSKKLFKGIPDYICIAIGVVYAYCGYTFVSNTYINWMDFLIWMPLSVGAFRRFVKTGKFFPFAAMMACSIYTCFSIACFSMFTVFPALIGYALLCVEKERRSKFIAYLCLAFAVAILLALPVLLPAFAAVSNSARGGTLFENFWTGYVMSDGTPVEFNSGSAAQSSYLTNYTDSVYKKWSYIVSDSVFLVLTVLWFIRKGLKDNFAKFMLVCGIFTLLPTVVDEAMNLMNMGSYMSYALRFGFLNALYFLGGACLCIEGLCFKNDHAYDGAFLEGRLRAPWNTEKTEPLKEDGDRYASKWEFLKNTDWKKVNKKAYAWSGAIALIGLAALVFLIWFINGDNYKTFLGFVAGDMEGVKSDLKWFSSSFAHSLGGLEVIVVPFVFVTVVAMLGAWLVSSKRISPKWLSFVLIAIVATQVAFYNMQLVAGNRSTQHVELGNYRTLAKEINARDDSYFRVKDYGKLNSEGTRSSTWTACAPFTGNTNAYSAFSSVLDSDNFAVYQLFGYDGNGKNSFKSSFNESKLTSGSKVYASDIFGDSFLNYKYFFVPESELEDADKKLYLKKVLATNESGEEVHLSDGDYYVYENTLVFPLGYTVKSGEYRFAAENTNVRAYRRRNQRELYKFLSGTDPFGASDDEYVTGAMVETLSKDLWSRAADVEVGAGKITARVSAKAGECLMLSFVASDGYTVTVNGKKAELIENDICFLAVELEEGENEVVFTYSSPYVKYAGLGLGGAVVALCVVWLVVKKTRLVEKCAPVIAWAGIALGVGLVAFFMLYPTSAFIAKVAELLKGLL